MSVFSWVLTAGQLAGALAAIGVACLGIWKYAIQPARKVAKVYTSIGSNGKETVFELLHGINSKLEKIEEWRTTVDDTLEQQNRILSAQDVALVRLIEQLDR